MDNAPTVVTAHSGALASGAAALLPDNSLGGRWRALPGRVQAMAVLGLMVLVGVLVLMASTARDSDYRPLFPGMNEKDSSEVVDRLVQMNVPYRMAEGGSVIMVPSARLQELKMKFAAAGLPSGSAGGAGTGYGILDKNSFGQTQGQERMKMQRAIEGELTTTIQVLDSVKSARVHLALPQQNGFFREQQKPSASVVLTLHPGRTLDRAQIAGIVRVVSGSVPDMAARAVSVVDSTGALLSSAGEDESVQGLDTQQLQYRRDVESSHLRRVMALLEPVVGRDNVRASISAEIDFSQVLQTAEVFGPNQGTNARTAVREQRSEEATNPGAAAAGGVPGATSNQPPVPATAPVNGASQAMQGTQAGGAGAGSARREAATRFEVDRTTTVTKSAVGAVRRLSAAVVVNHRTTTDAKGKPTTAPLTDKEIEQITSLVQQGIGFNTERGDLVKVINAPFRVDVVTAPEEVPFWKQPWLIELLKTAAAPAALALVALVVVAKLIRPALARMLEPPPVPEPGAQLDEVVGDSDEESPMRAAPLALGAPGHNDKVDAARAMAKANPAAVANIVRGWVNGEAA